MSLTREDLEILLFGTDQARRFTQDSPVYPDVWIGYGTDPGRPLDLLLTPHRRSSAGALAAAVRQRLERERATRRWNKAHPDGAPAAAVAHNQSSVSVRLSLDEMVRVLLPMTGWWSGYLWGRFLADGQRWAQQPLEALGHEILPPSTGASGRGISGSEKNSTDKEVHRPVAAVILDELTRSPGARMASQAGPDDPTFDFVWLVRLVGLLEAARQEATERASERGIEGDDEPGAASEASETSAERMAHILTRSVRGSEDPRALGRRRAAARRCLDEVGRLLEDFRAVVRPGQESMLTLLRQPEVRRRLGPTLARLREDGRLEGPLATATSALLERLLEDDASKARTDSAEAFNRMVLALDPEVATRIGAPDAAEANETQKTRGRNGRIPGARLVDAMDLLLREAARGIERDPTSSEFLGAPPPVLPEAGVLWSVSRNREATTSLYRSALTVKADAARRLFELSASRLTWAVIDSGIDASHPAFCRRRGDDTLPDPAPPEGAGTIERRRSRRQPWLRRSRVKATYDFTLVRYALDPSLDALDERIEDLEKRLGRAEETGTEDDHPGLAEEIATLERLRRRLDVAESDRPAEARDLRRSLLTGRSVDWSLLEPFLAVPHDETYRPPVDAHGTHVAGILAGDWRCGDPDSPLDDDENLVGMCPDMALYDLRVLDAEGRGSEFAVIAALQFVRHLNAHQDAPSIHGVNLSLSIPHDVTNFACGRTPVCEEAARLVGVGTVVVAAAGNYGYVKYSTPDGPVDAYRSISLTDPGNTELVITVGATHRSHPHTYGVSYFSSRGPTGDGRIKPDLVAPGEKIAGPGLDNEVLRLDGTSMAAPHVSGCAALLMARHPELKGDPERIKAILCETATDLGRERYFQGAGLVDVLRAIQSV